MATSAQLESASKRTQAVLKRLKDGADFKRTAIAASSGPKALEGGVWKYMNINEMPTLFSEVVKDAKKGDILGPVKSGSGFHIIKGYRHSWYANERTKRSSFTSYFVKTVSNPF